MEQQNKLRYRVVYGWNPKDFLAITEDELEKVKYAWVTDGIYKDVKGGTILRIEEDFRYYTGWNEGYEPKSPDDFAQIERDMPPLKLFEARRALAGERVRYIAKVQDREEKFRLLENPSMLDTILLTAPKN